MLYAWFFPLGIPNTILTENGSPFVAAFFEYICAALGVKQFGITDFHPETNDQTERYNKTLVARYPNERRRGANQFDQLVHTLTYGYNTQIHRTTGLLPFSMVLARNPPSSIPETIAGLSKRPG